MEGQNDEPAAEAAARAARSQGTLILGWAEGGSMQENGFLRDKIASEARYYRREPSKAEIVATVDSLMDTTCDDPSGGEMICSYGDPVVLSLNTGRDLAGAWIPAGTADDDWSVSADGQSFQDAQIVAAPPSPPWGVMPDAQWISKDGQTGASITGVSDYRYEFPFISPDAAVEARIEFDAFADNRIELVKVDGVSGGTRSGGSGMAGAPMHLEWENTWLEAGTAQVLWVDVVDDLDALGEGESTGLVLNGKITFCVDPEQDQIPPPPPFTLSLQAQAMFVVDNVKDPRNNIRGKLNLPQFTFGGDTPLDNSRQGLPPSYPFGVDGFRQRQTAVINPLTEYGDPIAEVGPRQVAHWTEQYVIGNDKCPPPNHPQSAIDGQGFLKQIARDDTGYWDFCLRHRWEESVPRDNWNVTGRWLSRDVSRIRIEVSSSDPLIEVVPPMDWIMDLTIDATDLQNIRYSVRTRHDGWPALDLFLDCERVFFRKPSTGLVINTPIDLVLPAVLMGPQQDCTAGQDCDRTWCGP